MSVNNINNDNRNLKLLLSLFEVLISLGVGIIFYFPLKNPVVGTIISIVGFLLVFNRILNNYLTAEIFKNTEQNIYQISKITDIRNRSNVDLISKILDVYLKITEPEFVTVKDKIINDSINNLNKLKLDKHSDELATSDYYQWLLPVLNNIGEGGKIEAISCMFNAEWDDSPEEQKFMKGNLEAAKKNAVVERIFLMRKNLLDNALKIEAVQAHSKEKRNETNLIGFFADREKIEKTEPLLLKSIGDGFIIFNSRFALIDRFDETGNVRGIVTMNEDEIRDMQKTFQKLKLISHDLSTHLFSPISKV